MQLVDLKAELLRKQEEFRQQKLQNATNHSLAVPKVSLLFTINNHIIFISEMFVCNVLLLLLLL